MFDLEQAIAGWRRQLARGAAIDRTVLDELESHLRDELDQQLRAGLEPQRAFAAAVERIGPPRPLRREFARAGRISALRCWELLGRLLCAMTRMAAFGALAYGLEVAAQRRLAD